jgi:hypothetical protein
VHAYPVQLADFVLDHWPSDVPTWQSRRLLVDLLSTCFQASLAREEGRDVRFRLLSSDASGLAELADAHDLPRFEFAERHAFTPDAVRRVSPAAPLESSLIAVTPQGDDDWVMWGIVHTGPSWLAPTWGGRREQQSKLALPMVHVLGPGRLGVYAGSDLVGSLERATIQSTTTDVFNAQWINNLFRRARAEVTASLGGENGGSGLNEALVRAISQDMVRRAIFLIRQGGYGGLLLFADPELISSCSLGASQVLKLKYPFRNTEARGRYRVLLKRLAGALGGSTGAENDVQRFLEAQEPEVDRIEQAVFELSRMVSGLAGVDGAVLLNKRFELIGFGAEVSGELPYPDTVYQALDVEGERREPEPANSVGTRHRAAYRFVTAHPGGVAIVISHDGVVRCVANLDGRVVYWDQFLNW